MLDKMDVLEVIATAMKLELKNDVSYGETVKIELGKGRVVEISAKEEKL